MMDYLRDYMFDRLKKDGWNVFKMHSPTGIVAADGEQSMSAYGGDEGTEFLIAKSRNIAKDNPTPQQLYEGIVNILHDEYEDGKRRFYIYMIFPLVYPDEQMTPYFGWVMRYDAK